MLNQELVRQWICNQQIPARLPLVNKINIFIAFAKHANVQVTEKMVWLAVYKSGTHTANEVNAAWAAANKK